MLYPAQVRYEYKKWSTSRLMRKRVTLIQQLIVCDEVLAKRGLSLLPPMIVELLAVAGKRHRDDPVVRPWHYTDE
jgi:hypothetical protein